MTEGITDDATREDYAQSPDLPDPPVSEAPEVEEPQAPEQPEEKEEQTPVPGWIYAPVQRGPQQEPAPPQYQPQYQQQYPQMPQQYQPVPQPQYPPQRQKMTWEQAVEMSPDELIDARVEQRLAELQHQVLLPVAQRTKALDDFMKGQHETAVLENFDRARMAVQDSYTKGEFAKDPAWKNEQVRGAADYLVRNYLYQAAERALKFGDHSGYRNVASPAVQRAILASAKALAGWPEGSGEPIRYSGTAEGSSTSSAPVSDVPKELREHAQQLASMTGADPESIIKQMKETEKMKKKLGWEG